MSSESFEKGHNMHRFTMEVKEEARRLGADLVGIASVARYEHAPKMLKPQAHLPEAKSVISMAVHHPDASVEWGGEPNPNYPGPFQIGMIPKLDTISLRVARFVEERGYRTIPLPCTFYWRHRPYKDIPYAHAAAFSHMTAFVAAGLGEYGWHGMVMSPKYGPRQRLVSVITSAELEPDPLYSGESLCDRCGMCEKHCPGRNYEKQYLLDPEYIEFKIEGKTFKYPNINRWRCFYGEQVHLDMTKLANEKDMSEEKIYEAMQKGTQRVAVGSAGYFCSSFKFCMAKPVRAWNRKYTPGPRLKKDIRPAGPVDLLIKIKALAINTGTSKLAIQPLANFEQLKGNLHKGFRTDDFYKKFSWVITIGRNMADYRNNGYLAGRNEGLLRNVVCGRLMMGIIDISRYLDDLGFEATQDWQQTGISKKAAEIAGWNKKDNGDILAASVICQAPLQEINKNLRLWAPPVKPEINAALPFLKYIDKIGVAALDKMDGPEISAIKKMNSGFRTLIVLLNGMPSRVVELAGRQAAECGMAYAFVNYQLIRETLWAAHDLSDWLKEQGHEAIPLLDLTKDSFQTLGSSVGQYLPDLRANAPFAAAAGLGDIGRHGMLLTPEFGPRQRYAFVLTSAELKETARYKGPALCRKGCRLCAEACPVQALNQDKTDKLSLNGGNVCEVFERHETRCRWARNLGMVAEEGPGLLGWKIPDLPVPDKLTEEKIKEALARKDPIQSVCYKNPNHADIVIERCLQVCPAGNALR